MKAFYITLTTSVLLVIFAVFHEKGRDSEASTSDTIRVSDTIHTSDTLTLTVTVIRDVPTPYIVEVVRRDTVHSDTILERTRKTYKTDEYTAIVEGIDPSLSYMETKNKYVTIRDTILVRNSETITKTIKKPPRWVLSAGVGTGFSPRGIQPIIGIHFGYVFWSR